MQNENDEFVWPFPSIMEVYDRIQTTLPIEEMGIDILPLVNAMGEISWIKVSYYTKGHPLSQYPTYPYIDFYAIVIKNADGVKIGYVPKADNMIFSRLMDAGKLLFGRITLKEMQGKWLKIDIKVFLNE